jgi:type VI protein secretion system component Hcp
MTALSCPASSPASSFSPQSWSLGVSNGAEFSPLSINKPVDSCSPALASAAATGQHFDKATLTTQTGAGLTLKFVLTDVIVTSDAVSGVTESLTLTFDQIQMTVTQ